MNVFKFLLGLTVFITLCAAFLKFGGTIIKVILFSSLFILGIEMLIQKHTRY